MDDLETDRPLLIPNVLSIAGSDPSGGAGIQADLKTFAAFGCHGMAVVTALTAQNTTGVRAVHLPPASVVADGIKAILDDIDVAAVKIGMLGSAEIAAAVAEALSGAGALPIVVDPVLSASSGAALADDGVIEMMRGRLFPLARLVTPNIPEAVRLSGAETPATRADIEGIAHRLAEGGRAAWLVKGGHFDRDDRSMADDFLLDDGQGRWLSSPRVPTRNSHGTGCTLSAAIAAGLAHGVPLAAAVEAAKAYLDRALAGADRLSVGHGSGPLDHFVDWRGSRR